MECYGSGGLEGKVLGWDASVSWIYLCSPDHHSLPSSGSSCFRLPYTDIYFPFPGGQRELATSGLDLECDVENSILIPSLWNGLLRSRASGEYLWTLKGTWQGCKANLRPAWDSNHYSRVWLCRGLHAVRRPNLTMKRPQRRKWDDLAVPKYSPIPGCQQCESRIYTGANY